MKIFSAKQMQDLDACTIQKENISSLDLMEKAGSLVAAEIMKLWTKETPVVVFAGPGNNGGDALVTARILIQNQYAVTSYLFNINDKISEECLANKERLLELDTAQFFEIKDKFESPLLTDKTLVVDGIFGTGLTKALTGGFAALVKFINNSPAKVASIDMPSGLFCEDNSYNVYNHIISADWTFTFELPKLAQLLAANQTFVGELRILPLGLSKEKIESTDAAYEWLEKDMAANLLKPRSDFAHKGNFGHALVIAGKYGMAGAAILTAKACLRAGVGKVTVHTPLKNNDILQISVPEAIMHHDAKEINFTTPVNTDGYSSVAIGPGIGLQHETAVAFIEQVRRSRAPLVIDADGINILSLHKGWLQQVPVDAIMTPHPKELERLVGKGGDDYVLLREARELAMRSSLFVILKGHYTAICAPNGKTYFNSTGNSGMATAGSGDALTGVITALLAQGYDPLSASLLGVYLHGLAGDIAARKNGKHAMIASDIIEALPAAFKVLLEAKKQL